MLTSALSFLISFFSLPLNYFNSISQRSHPSRTLLISSNSAVKFAVKKLNKWVLTSNECECKTHFIFTKTKPIHNPISNDWFTKHIFPEIKNRHISAELKTVRDSFLCIEFNSNLIKILKPKWFRKVASRNLFFAFFWN